MTASLIGPGCARLLPVDPEAGGYTARTPRCATGRAPVSWSLRLLPEPPLLQLRSGSCGRRNGPVVAPARWISRILSINPCFKTGVPSGRRKNAPSASPRKCITIACERLQRRPYPPGRISNASNGISPLTGPLWNPLRHPPRRARTLGCNHLERPVTAPPSGRSRKRLTPRSPTAGCCRGPASPPVLHASRRAPG